MPRDIGPSLPLALTCVLPLLLQWFLSLKGKEWGLSIPQILILYILTSREFQG